MMLLLLPTRTFALPLMTPLTTTIAGALFFSLTAAVNSASVDTVVTVPPAPPVVLHVRNYQLRSMFDPRFKRPSYPPLRVAYPRLAASEILALFASRAVPDSG